jgi:hypothetical protein
MSQLSASNSPLSSHAVEVVLLNKLRNNAMNIFAFGCIVCGDSRILLALTSNGNFLEND